LEEGIANKNARSEFRASVKKKMFFKSFVARSRSVSQRRKTVSLFQSYMSTHVGTSSFFLREFINSETIFKTYALKVCFINRAYAKPTLAQTLVTRYIRYEFSYFYVILLTNKTLVLAINFHKLNCILTICESFMPLLNK
jgi:hypothetical protein